MLQIGAIHDSTSYMVLMKNREQHLSDLRQEIETHYSNDIPFDFVFKLNGSITTKSYEDQLTIGSIEDNRIVLVSGGGSSGSSNNSNKLSSTKENKVGCKFYYCNETKKIYLGMQTKVVKVALSKVVVTKEMEAYKSLNRSDIVQLVTDKLDDNIVDSATEISDDVELVELPINILGQEYSIGQVDKQQYDDLQQLAQDTANNSVNDHVFNHTKSSLLADGFVISCYTVGSNKTRTNKLKLVKNQVLNEQHANNMATLFERLKISKDDGNKCDKQHFQKQQQTALKNHGDATNNSKDYEINARLVTQSLPSRGRRSSASECSSASELAVEVNNSGAMAEEESFSMSSTVDDTTEQQKKKKSTKKRSITPPQNNTSKKKSKRKGQLVTAALEAAESTACQGRTQEFE